MILFLFDISITGSGCGNGGSSGTPSPPPPKPPADPCRQITIVPRDGWNGMSPTSRRRMQTPAPFVFIHHTAGRSCSSFRTCEATVRGIQRDHMRNGKIALLIKQVNSTFPYFSSHKCDLWFIEGWSDIGYSFLIGGDFMVYEGRGWGIEGAHTKYYNRNAHGIAFIRNYHRSSPSAFMLNTAKKLIKCGVKLVRLVPFYRG